MIVALRIDSRRPYQISPLLSISLVFLGAGLAVLVLVPPLISTNPSMLSLVTLSS